MVIANPYFENYELRCMHGYILLKTGKNNLFAKGSLFGMTFGSTITALLSGFGSNKVKPKDAKSNLTYIFSSGIFGLVTTYAAALLGDDSLWDTPPANNYLPPTQPTSAEKARQTPIPANEPSDCHESSINSN